MFWFLFGRKWQNITASFMSYHDFDLVNASIDVVSVVGKGWKGEHLCLVFERINVRFLWFFVAKCCELSANIAKSCKKIGFLVRFMKQSKNLLL